MIDLTEIISILKVVVLSSVFFVWFIRYDNIVEEFNSYGYSEKLRDLVGILKITCVIMIQSSDPTIVKLGSAALAGLMLCAMATHIRVRNPLLEIAPSSTLMAFSVIIFFNA